MLDLAADISGDLVLGAVTVHHDEPLRFGGGEPQITVANAPMEVRVQIVKAVPLTMPFGDSGNDDIDRRVDEKRAMWHEIPHREAGQRAEALEVGAVTVPLVRQHRVEETIRDDDLARIERRPNDLADELCTSR